MEKVKIEKIISEDYVEFRLEIEGKTFSKRIYYFMSSFKEDLDNAIQELKTEHENYLYALSFEII